MLPCVSLLIKPASGRCNMRCRYCFYRDVADRRSCSDPGIMTPDTAAAIIRHGFECGARDVRFCFQGGEPTLAGEDFFRFFCEEADRLRPVGCTVSYAIQTNGLALSDGLIDLFAAYDFLVGVSLDGPAALHDPARPDAAGNGTYARVLDTLGRLRRRGVAVNLLTVLTDETAPQADAIYDHFTSLGYDHLQFIPCLAPLSSGGCFLSADAYGDALIRLFDRYYRDFTAGRYVSIRFFDNLVIMARGGRPELCGMSGVCPGQIVVESDGTVYPCDFYCTDDRALGDLVTSDLPALLASPVLAAFMQESLTAGEECRTCPYVRLCRGGCRRMRDRGRGVPETNVFCAGLKRFFAHALPALADLAQNGF